MSKSKLVGIAVITVLLLSLSFSVVAAQYTTQKITDVAISSDGTFSATESDVGVSYLITGTPGATGTVTAAVYNGNPQPNADIPDGILLTHYVVVTFDMDADQFLSANIIISYTDSDVQNILQPYTIYKYVPSTDSFVELSSTVDTEAKTITITVTSIDDPLFAVGGATTAIVVTAGIPAYVWVVLAVSVIAIVLIAVLLVSRLRRPDEGI